MNAHWVGRFLTYRWAVSRTSFHVIELETRLSFHFGNVAVTKIPKVFLRLEVDVNGITQEGTAMGGLIPGWFYKDLSS